MNKSDARKLVQEIKDCCASACCSECPFHEILLDSPCPFFGRESAPKHWNFRVAVDISEFERLKKQPTPSEYNHHLLSEPLLHRHPQKNDMIHHPGHYNFRGMECKDFIEKFVSDPKSYYEGNIFKYLYRYLEKNKEEDLNKAMEYTRLLKEYLYGKKD